MAQDNRKQTTLHANTNPINYDLKIPFTHANFQEFMHANQKDKFLALSNVFYQAVEHQHVNELFLDNLSLKNK